jgi:hypothetical protein
MKSSKAWLGLPLVLILAACGGDAGEVDDAALNEGAEVMPPATEPAATTPPPGGAAMAAAPQTASFQATGDSGVTGEATITPRDQQLEVMVRLTGASGAGEHPGHIHSGTCDNIGGVVQPLQPITTDASGSGTMTATVDMAPMTVMNGQHVISYHAAGGGPTITCAPIPMHAM